jgi:hypothetical protein
MAFYTIQDDDFTFYLFYVEGIHVNIFYLRNKVLGF